MTTVHQSFTWSYTGAQQSWQVPVGVSSITVTAKGAGNGAEKGGQSVLTIPVTEGRVIYGNVGGSGGWNGGGPAGVGYTASGSSGAGATDLRIGGTGLANRVLIAGGAGGRGYASSYAAGVGGGLTGGTGGFNSGHGGTATAGGAHTGTSGGATDGVLGVGGHGAGSPWAYGAGAGGGGLYGGGGGDGNNNQGDSGGGGGGSALLAASAPDGATSGGTTTAGGGNTGNGSMTIEYDQDLSAPYEATLVSPASAQVLDASSGIPFKLIFNSSDGQDCNAATLRVKTGTGAYSYLDVANSDWSDTEVWNTLDPPVADGGTIEFDVPASTAIANGNSYSWSGNTQEAGDDLQGTYVDDSAFVASDPPAVDITAPADGSTVTDTDKPAAEWTAVLHPDTGAQTKYRTVWETGDYGTEPGSGTSVDDTGEVTGDAASVTPTKPLPNDATVRQFVWIEETDGQDSAWAYVTFTVQVSPPSAPTVAPTAGTDSVSGLPTVTVTVTVADSDAFDHTDTTVQVQASLDGGSTWATVRDASTGDLATALALDDDGAATVVDAEAVFGAETLYRAIATGTSGELTIASGWSATASATLDVDGCWLIDPLDISTALQVDVTVDDTRTRPITQDILATLGSTDPVVSSDVRQRGRGSFTWECADLAERTALEQLLAGRNVLLQRTGAESADPGVHVYFRPLADLATDRLTQQVPTSLRDVKSAWIARPRPS